MKKRFPAIILALALCMGLAVPAFAADSTAPETWQEAFADVTASYTLGDGHIGGINSVAWQDKEWTMVDYEFDDEGNTVELPSTESGYRAIRNDTVFTVSRAAGSADDTSFVRVYVYSYTAAGGGRYEWSNFPHGLCLTNDGEFILNYMDPEELGGYVELKPGESVQFKLPKVYDEDENEITDVIYQVALGKTYPDFTTQEMEENGESFGYSRWWYYKVDEACVDETAAELPFDDVRMGAYYDLSVIWAVKNEITNGMGYNDESLPIFEPGIDCTHIQILTFLYRAERGEGKASADDMDEAKAWAEEKGMIDDSFEANAKCTRAQAVNYIWQAKGKPDAKEASSFSDVPEDADYAAAASWAAEAGVTKGVNAEGTLFDPDTVCTRGHIVTFLFRAYED